MTRRLVLSTNRYWAWSGCGGEDESDEQNALVHKPRKNRATLIASRARQQAGLILKCAQVQLFLVSIGLGTRLLENGQLWDHWRRFMRASCGVSIKYEFWRVAAQPHGAGRFNMTRKAVSNMTPRTTTEGFTTARLT